VFDASTLSQNRRRRFNGTTVAKDIFDAIVEQAIAKGLVARFAVCWLSPPNLDGILQLVGVNRYVPLLGQRFERTDVTGSLPP
jgi:hypothetical protein